MSDLEEILSGDEVDEGQDEMSASILQNLQDSDDSDAAPEDMSVSQSKEEALLQVNSYLKLIQQKKTQLRSKRHKQQQRNVAQKRKGVSVSSQKLPASLLESIAPVVTSIQEPKAKKDKKTSKHTTFDEDEEEGSIDGNFSMAADFISFNKNKGIQPLCLQDVGKEPISQQRAVDFKHNQFFGSKVRRDTNGKDFLSRKAKKRVLSAQRKS